MPTTTTTTRTTPTTRTTNAPTRDALSPPVLTPRRTQVARCPFCHADVRRRAERVLACEQCGAHHHAACWSEGQGCSGCGARALESPELTRELTNEPSSELSSKKETASEPRRSWLRRHPIRAALGVVLAGFVLYEVFWAEPDYGCRLPLPDRFCGTR